MASYAKLVALLGKAVDDPAVKTTVGKAKVGKESIEAKADGYELVLGRPTGASTKAPKLLTQLHLYPGGAENYKRFAGLPAPFAFDLDRAALIKLAPARAWKLGSDAKITDPEAFRFYWDRDGYEVSANLSLATGALESYIVTPPEDALGGRDLSTHPLHFEAAPADAPADAKVVGMALLLAWATEKLGPAAKHAAAGKALAKRAITPGAFFRAHCKSTLTSLDVAPVLGPFLHGYTNRMFLDDGGTRAAAKRAIKKSLRLERADEIAYTDDFLGTFRDLESRYYVPDSWDAVDRIAPVLDARWADYQKTKFKTAPDLAAYEKAAKLRDAVTVAPAQQGRTGPGGALDAAALIAAIGKPLTDKAVKDLIIAAGMAVGKKIDEQANPALGVSYMGEKEKGKMRVGDATFYAAKEKRHIRGLGQDVIFEGFAGTLPLGVKLGDARAKVQKAYGKPATTSADSDRWYPRKDRQIIATYSKAGILVRLNFGFPADWLEPPTPPFGPAGIFK